MGGGEDESEGTRSGLPSFAVDRRERMKYSLVLSGWGSLLRWSAAQECRWHREERGWSATTVDVYHNDVILHLVLP